MVWAGVTADRRTDLVVVPGILTGQRYIDKILRPHVVPFLRPVGNNGIFQDDNARPHRARIVDGFLQANNVRRLEWPAMSPDLSCIEHVWDVLGKAVQKRMAEHNTTLERNGSESLKLRSGSLCFQHGRDLLSSETIGVAILTTKSRC